MNEKSYPRIGETVLEKTLPNGLKIFIVPKPQHRKKYAFFATRYGGMDMQFIRNGEKCDTPAGIAHYLEHKMLTRRTATPYRYSRKTAQSRTPLPPTR